MYRCGWLLLGMLLPTLVFAAPDQAAVDNKEYPSIFSGYIVGSYNYLLRSNRFISGQYDRLYDLAENGFTLQQAGLTIAKQPDQGLGGLISFVLGRDALSIAPSGLNADVFNSDDIGFTIAQAYVQYARDSWLFRGGELLSLSGFEQYDYMGDTNFSRSILDGYAQAGTHVGLRLIKTINDNWSWIIGTGNGWSTIETINQQNIVELAINYTIGMQIALTIDTYSGVQHYTDSGKTGPTSWRNLLDMFGTYNITDRWSVAFNYDYGMQPTATIPNGTGRATWQGIAGYLNATWNDKWNSSLRAEVFNDMDGYRTGVRQNWRELTLSLAYLPIKKMTLRGEVRHDFSNRGAFRDKSGNGVNNNQQSYAFEALYEF